MKPKFTLFSLAGSKEQIFVVVDVNGRITIITADGNKDFRFIKSDPNRVKRMGELLIKASELA